MHMRIIGLLLMLPSLAFAGDELFHSRSVGKYLNDSSTDLSLQLQQTRVLEYAQQEPVQPDSGTSQSQLAYHDEAIFEIFDAWLALSGDLDDDGFYHHLRVSFDADVNTEQEVVYAKLYLSREGGPWLQYAETDLFEIYADSADDSYEVLTELIDGYPPGYYDILIELHSLYHPGIVASRIIDEYDAGFAIALEDLEYDDPYYYPDYGYVDVSYGVGVSGAFNQSVLSILALLMLYRLYLKIKRSRATQDKGEVMSA
jgi:hypothetical protein